MIELYHGSTVAVRKPSLRPGRRQPAGNECRLAAHQAYIDTFGTYKL